MERLRKRGEFLRVAVGEKWATPGFVLQARARADLDGPARVGFTASRKVGNAVARNRARRRLRAAARLILSPSARAGHDYVLVARRGTLTRPFHTMLDELVRAVHMVHERLDTRARGDSPARGGTTKQRTAEAR